MGKDNRARRRRSSADVGNSVEFAELLDPIPPSLPAPTAEHVEVVEAVVPVAEVEEVEAVVPVAEVEEVEEVEAVEPVAEVEAVEAVVPVAEVEAVVPVAEIEPVEAVVPMAEIEPVEESQVEPLPPVSRFAEAGVDDNRLPLRAPKRRWLRR